MNRHRTPPAPLDRALVFLLSLAALLTAASASAQVPEGCTGPSAEPAGPTALACLYTTTQTPEALPAQASGGFVWSSLNNLNRAYRVTLSGDVGDNESAVLFWPTFSGIFGFYSNAEAPLSILNEFGQIVEPLFEDASLAACPDHLPRLALYELSDELEYRIVFGAQDAPSLTLTLAAVSEITFYPDVDGDGWGALEGTLRSWCGSIAGYVTQGGDCDDSSPSVHPDAREVCNGVDDDCDGERDEGGNICAGEPLGGACVGAGDPAAYCGCLDDADCAAPSVCRLNECQLPAEFSPVPEGCAGVSEAANSHTCLHGAHGPYGSVAGVAPGGFVTADISTPHTLYTVTLAGSPGSNASVVLYDPGTTNYYGFYTNEDFPLALEAPNGDEVHPVIVASPETCTEHLQKIHVFALEAGLTYRVTLGPSSDSTVDVAVESLSSYPQTLRRDADEDGYASARGEQISTWCAQATGYAPLSAENPADCDDTNASIWPGATELCNGVDDDCDGEIDEGCDGCSSDDDCETGALCDPASGRCEAPPSGSGGGSGSGGASSSTGGTHAGSGGRPTDDPSDDPAGDSGGCSVASRPRGASGALQGLLLLAALGLRRSLSRPRLASVSSRFIEEERSYRKE